MGELLDPGTPGNQEQPGGTPAASLVGELDESLRGEKSLGKFKDKNELAKSYVELERKLGSALQMPGKDASDEDWGKFFSKVGRPEAPDKYELPAEGLSDSLKQRIREEAFKAGATPKQVKAIVDSMVLDAKANVEAFKQQQEARKNEAVAALKKEYGAEFDSKIVLANKALVALFPSAASTFLENGLANHPALIRDLAALGARLGEDKLVHGESAAAKNKDPYAWMLDEFKQT